MDKTRIIQLAGALAISLGALFWVKSTLTVEKPKTRVVVKDKVEYSKVLVAARDIEIGTSIRAQDLKWADWPKKAVSGKMITRERQPDAISKFTNDGARARAPMIEGEPVIASKFLMANSGFLAMTLKKGMRAIAVRVSVETGAGGFIRPNDRVDVLLVRRNKGNSFADVVLSNVRVLAIDQTTIKATKGKNGDKVADRSIKTATLELTPEQAKAIARAENMGQLTLVLRSLAESEQLHDDMPHLSPKFAAGGDVRVLRSGVMTRQVRN